MSNKSSLRNEIRSIINIIDTTFNGIIYPFLMLKCNISKLSNFILNIIIITLRVIDLITFILAIYFMYEFGYNQYRNCCNPCHEKMYECCKNKQKKEIESGKRLKDTNDKYIQME